VADAARIRKLAGVAEVAVVLNGFRVRRIEIDGQFDAGRSFEMLAALGVGFCDHGLK